MTEEERAPNLYDYLAGAILANGFVWIWAQILPHLKRIPATLLAEASYIIYLAGGIATSYLVCKRTSSKHLLVGIKLAVLTWVFSIFLMLNIAADPTFGLAIALFIIFMGGGVAGAYLALRSTLRPRKEKPGAADANLKNP